MMKQKHEDSMHLKTLCTTKVLMNVELWNADDWGKKERKNLDERRRGRVFISSWQRPGSQCDISHFRT